ncbi:MAG: EutN/CcmL family microcompartment protein [Deltaproteobacteria bacterium]|nr:EutN/CcmL family microcompartment protein [Deltaproteobacteria bacterium]
MYLGRVVGTVVAQTKAEGLSGQKLLLVQPLDHDQKPNGPIEAAVDTVRAGPGDLVFLVGSREASLALEEAFVPVDAAIVGFVDSVHAGGGK